MASGIAALAAGIQFMLRFRRGERVRARRRLLGSEVAKLQTLRRRIEDAGDPAEAQALLREADDLLGQAEQDAAADLLDADAIQTLRSVHEGCWRALQRQQATPAHTAASRAPIHLAGAWTATVRTPSVSAVAFKFNWITRSLQRVLRSDGASAT